MIDRDIELTDGREYHHHQCMDPEIDLSKKRITVNLLSFESEDDATGDLIFYATIEFSEWDPSLMDGIEAQVSELEWQTIGEVSVVETFEQAVTRRLKELNDSYNKANTGLFVYAGFEFNADPIAQNNINGTANYINQFGSFPPEFANKWFAADGSTIPMETTEAFWDFYKAFTAQGVYNINRFDELKNQILAAESIEDLDGIPEW